MSLPGFNAEAATTVRNRAFHMGALYGKRSPLRTVSMAAQCCPPGFDATGCQSSPPPLNCPPCPPGGRCCGSCASGRCVGFCVGPNQVCRVPPI